MITECSLPYGYRLNLKGLSESLEYSFARKYGMTSHFYEKVHM